MFVTKDQPIELNYEVVLHIHSHMRMPSQQVALVVLHQAGSVEAARVALKLIKEGVAERDRSHWVWSIVKAVQTKYPSVGFFIGLRNGATGEELE